MLEHRQRLRQHRTPLRAEVHRHRRCRSPTPRCSRPPATRPAPRITALEITKAEPSPEAKLLRGVHDHPTVYTLTVTNTAEVRHQRRPRSPTTCRPRRSSSAAARPTTPPAGRRVPRRAAADRHPGRRRNCPTPASVDTVANPPANGSVSYPAGIYTKVVWNLGTLAAGQTVTINYAAGIPLRQNVLFSGGPSAGLARPDRQPGQQHRRRPPGRSTPRPARPTTPTRPAATPARSPPAAARRGRRHHPPR